MFLFNKADIVDCSLINNLASRIWENTYGNILSKEQLEYMFEMMYSPENIQKQITEHHHQFFIVQKDNIPSGYLSIEQQDDNIFILQKIYSLPEVQGTGIGRFMIEQGVAYLKSIHPNPFTLVLYVNRENPAVGFYKHIGFKEISTRDYHIGNGYYMNDYIMSLEVK